MPAPVDRRAALERPRRAAPFVDGADRFDRFDRIDLLRAGAMLWMTVFHLCFDLNHMGWLAQDFYRDPFWTVQRSAIVSAFLFTAGLSQAVALHRGQSWARFGRRWVQVAGAALLVSAGSVLLFPNSFIYFGVLHGMAVMLVLARLTARWGAWLWPLGALALALPWLGPWAMGAMPALEVFNTRGLNWLGFISQKPITEDYVPLLPWLGVLWWGQAAGRWALQHRPAWLGTTQQATAGGVRRALVRLGQWSLTYYLLHQPVLMAALAGLVWLRG